MKTNVTFLCSNGESRVLEASRATKVMQVGRVERHPAAPSRTPPRSALVMIWRTHPISGRLECRWVVEGGTATSEGVSCGQPIQRAA
jgi:hypothetical protein